MTSISIHTIWLATPAGERFRVGNWLCLGHAKAPVSSPTVTDLALCRQGCRGHTTLSARQRGRQNNRSRLLPKFQHSIRHFWHIRRSPT